MEYTSDLGPALALAGGAVAALLGGIGSSLGVGAAGITGAGVATERPEAFGKILVLEALPGSQGIYGLIGAFLVLNFFSGTLFDLTYSQGLQIFFACMPLAFTALFSGIFQGKVAAAGMNILAKNPANVGQAIVLAAIVETFAILGILSTFLMLTAIKNSL
jgi:V/A-type H+-transporting ATPase subunit K